jgi:hypothetical protein
MAVRILTVSRDKSAWALLSSLIVVTLIIGSLITFFPAESATSSSPPVPRRTAHVPDRREMDPGRRRL